MTPKGWCPGIHEPMPAADGLLVRVKPPQGRLTTEQARRLDAAADAFGNGTIELTNRANLQVRGLSPDTVAGFAHAMVAAGLADADPAHERRRAVMFPPFARDDAVAIATAVEAGLPNDLPPKFVVAVDAGGQLPLAAEDTDIVVACGEATCRLVLPGTRLGAAIALADAAAAALRMVMIFQQFAAGIAPSPRRMRSLVAAIGAPRLLAAADLQAMPQPASPPPPRAVGWLSGAFGVGVPFGAMRPAALSDISALADRFGDPILHLTPWRAVILAGIALHDVPALANAASGLGLIVDADDPRRGIVACVGRSGCASASVDTRADAAGLLELGLQGPIHVAGCAKGCAHPAPAPLTLVGNGGSYDIIRDGRASDPRWAGRLTMTQAVAMLRLAGA